MLLNFNLSVKLWLVRVKLDILEGNKLTGDVWVVSGTL